ncbi:MAG: phosphatidate cytidylyltransferase [Alphaproteobacteria bacterium]|nr:phosphatidate cytidylyltransferase [Alphaproteobacteria bacterium]
MSAATRTTVQMAGSGTSASDGPAAPRPQPWRWMLRPVFGLILAGMALLALVAGGIWFAGFIALGTSAGVREWHRMVSRGDYRPFLPGSIVALLLGLSLAVFATGGPERAPAAYGLAGAGYAAAALLAAAVAWMRSEQVLWQGIGPLYLGLPGLSLFALRATPDHGLWLVLTLFAAVWACDTGALVCGKLIGGPKLVPRLSPNKTWAGFVGGSVSASAAAALALATFGAEVWRGALFGLIIALISHGGDMFESWVKRRVGRKDSGHLIPGHGGVLDRIDSILFAAPCCAAFVFFFGAQALLGGNL